MLIYAFAYQGFIVGTIAGACRFYNESGMQSCDSVQHFIIVNHYDHQTVVYQWLNRKLNCSFSMLRWKHPTRERIICAREEKVNCQSDQQPEGSFLRLAYEVLVILEIIESNLLIRDLRFADVY